MIKDIIENFVDQFPELSNKEKKELALQLNVEKYDKRQIIQKEGKVPHNCFFVLRGLVREYKIVDGVDKTLEFYSVSHPAIPSEDHAKVRPSETSLECLEDSFLLVGNSESESKSIESIPALQGIITQIAEEEWTKATKKLSTFKTLSPEERYLNFLEKRGDLKNRVPENQIASYLGITPESLSRIKKRLLNKSKLHA